ncbi:phage tail sheath C-terminal domain-containing protein [uncultured Aquimarina sp.]|uniref:phage tail sheath family protein n=1 Tax=uncultured Aquimarina sp. TaxID=575652 RepID=UPI002630491C|nr:phage tail sheath C-terminal domain-containing protein [uncultured Aquimarina sp.]
MSRFLTPDVYTEEVPLLPQSVAEVSTAVPAFIGYTEKTKKNEESIKNKAYRISTLLEFKELFGGAQSASFNVTVNEGVISGVAVTPPKHTLYHAIELYFKNGGGDCYIVSVGSYEDTYNAASFMAGLEAVSKEDEPTLLMLGEATKLDAVDYHDLCVAALAQCQELKDRFCIFDVKKDDEDASSFRTAIGTNNLKYGAAYTPYLQTSLTYKYQEDSVIISGSSAQETIQLEVNDAIRIIYQGSAQDEPKTTINKGSAGTLSFSISGTTLTITNVGEGVSANEVVDAWNAFSGKGDFDIIVIDGTATVESFTGNRSLTTTGGDGASTSLSTIKETQSELYNRVISEVSKQRIILPPSAAVAGAYATTDRERGVWKAPANVSLNGIIAPVKKITSKDQEDLNVDSKNGKSINAIRSFVGKGTLVWGARTLDGNDNEWRYVSVRRLFNMIEESTKKASQFAVFESNDAVTWLKVKAMIESFLYGIWQQGGLAGATEEQAYFVNIGLGKTMTQQDVLEGRMIAEIGLAAVRPAEFIILKFSHKLQEA